MLKMIARMRKNVQTVMRTPPGFSEICDVYRRESEKLQVKQTQNVSFPEGRKIESYMKTQTYARVAKKDEWDQPSRN